MNDTNKKLLLGGIGVAVLGGIAVAALFLGDTTVESFDPSSEATSDGFFDGPAPKRDVAVEGLPPVPDAPVALAVPAEPELFPSVTIDLFDPAAVLTAARDNEWMTAAMASSLGRGFLGGWSGFFAARGDHIGARFEGTMLEMLVAQVFDQPTRILWMGSERRRYSPVLVIEAPDRGAQMAYDAITAAAQRGAFAAPRCPASEADEPMNIARIVVADRAVYATKFRDALVIGRHPDAVLHGACAERAPLEPVEGVAFEIAVESGRFDRGVQSLLHFAGVGTAPRLAFGVEGNKFFPRGIRAPLRASRLGAAALSPGMRDAIPVDTPIFLAVAITLPAELSVAGLEALLKGEGGREGVARRVAFLWTPAANGPDEVAILWSRPEDRDALRKIFSPAMSIQPVCGQLVLSTSADATKRVQTTCRGKSPSLAHADPAVKSGLEADASVVLGVQVGRLTRHLFLESWDEEQKKQKKGPPKRPEDVSRAADALGALPFFGFTGTADGAQLAPKGFRS